MSLAAMHPGRCRRCHGTIERGDAIDYYPPAPGVKAEVAHVACPEQPQPTPRNTKEALWEDGDCSACGQSWSARVGRDKLPATSPCCGAPWREEP